VWEEEEEEERASYRALVDPSPPEIDGPVWGDAVAPPQTQVEQRN
jgi:hypothetical protein